MQKTVQFLCFSALLLLWRFYQKREKFNLEREKLHNLLKEKLRLKLKKKREQNTSNLHQGICKFCFSFTIPNSLFFTN